MTYMGPARRKSTSKFFNASSNLLLAAGLAAGLVGFAACGDSAQSFFVDGGNGDDDAGGNPFVPSDSGLTGTDLGDASVAALYFDPPAATLTVDGTNVQKQNYALHAKLVNGSDVVVSPESLQFDRPDLAQTTNGAPVVMATKGPFGGTGTLHAIVKGKEATAKLTIVVNLKELGAGVDATADAAGIAALDAGGLGADPSLTALSYPYDQTVFPLGLASPLLMWTAPKNGDLYRVHLEEKGYTYDGYFKPTTQAQVRALQDSWDHLTASNGGDPVKLTLSRYDSSSHVAYDSAKESWTIASASLRGAIYYWTTSGTGHLARIRPGTGAAPEVMDDGNQAADAPAKKNCMGCHAVSADGKTLVASVESRASIDEGSPNQNSNLAAGSLNQRRAWVSFALPAGTQGTISNRFAGNLAVTPEGKYTVFGSVKLHIAPTATGVEIVNSGLDNYVPAAGMAGLMTPAFSPDGKKFIAVQGVHGAGHANWYDTLQGGNLELFTFDGATGTFSSPTALAAASSFTAGENAINYPTFSPDSSLVAFNVGQAVDGCQGNCLEDEAQGNSGIWVQSTSGSAPIRLTALNDSSLNAADDDLAYEPTFNPVARGNYFWVVFSSERDWGNRITGTANNGKKRLWVAAVDATTGATDPSHPAFFLEGQEEDTSNMRGFWSLAACTASGPAPGGSCSAGFECCSGFCDRGACVDVSTLSCQGDGDACTKTEDCCNAGAVTCVAGKCTPNQPR